VKTLSERVGHADTSATMKIYAHWRYGIDRSMAQAMGVFIEQATGLMEPQESPVAMDLVTRPSGSAPEADTDPQASTG
jgi:hypothetical protein